MEENNEAPPKPIAPVIKAASPAVCPKCNNTGQVTEKNGTIHICYDCLLSGRLDQHGDKNRIREAKEFGIKL